MSNLKRLIEEAKETRLEKKFKKNLEEHRERVNKFAAILGKSYPEHDKEKASDLLYGYQLSEKDNRTDEEQKLYDEVTAIHIKQSAHHPEHWDNVNLTHFTRHNPIGCDASKMTREALTELCCDWCATAIEHENSPYEWAKLNIPARWRFTENQTKFIFDTLEKLWPVDRYK